MVRGAIWGSSRSAFSQSSMAPTAETSERRCFQHRGPNWQQTTPTVVVAMETCSGESTSLVR
eukprot:5867124-Amphidinium_carterae.1